MSQIYDTLTPDVRFIFYRRLPVLSSGGFSRSSFFSNYSLISSPPASLNDNFTDKLVISGLTDPHNFSTFAQTEVNNYHIANRDLYRTSKFTNYYNDISLWPRIETVNKNPDSAGRFYLDADATARNYFMN